MKLINAIIDHIFGRKYYCNIVNTRGTAKCETTSFIHHTKEEARKHQRDIEETRTFLFMETVSFRSHKEY